MSWVWQFFEKIDNTLAHCLICQKEYSYRSTSHNLKKHLDMKHPTLTGTEGEGQIQSASTDEEAEPLEKKPKLLLRAETDEHITDQNVNSDNEHIQTECVETEVEVEHKPPGRTRARTSWIWQYFERIDSARAQCQLCSGTYTYQSTIGNLRKHLEGRHPRVTSSPDTTTSSPSDVKADPVEGDAEYTEKGRRSWIWPFFTSVDSSHATCQLCGGRYSYESSSNNLQKHLLRMHPEIVPDKPDRSYSKVSASRKSVSEEANSKEQFTEVFIASPDSPDCDRLETPARRQTDDALEQFGRYIAVLMRRLPEEVANSMQAEFVTKIMQAQIEHDKTRASRIAQKRSSVNGNSENGECPLTDVILEVTNS